MRKEFEKFTKSDLGLEIWSEGEAIFCSQKNGIQGLLEFINKNEKTTGLVIFDKKVGNAAALLCIYIGAKQVYGVVGSKTAEKTLKENKIKFYFSRTIPNILNKDETDICPMEKMSLSKSPEEFYNLTKISNLIAGGTPPIY